MKRFTKARAASIKAGERNDCSVKAVSIAARVPYNKAHHAMDDQGRKTGKGASMAMIWLAIQSLGCRFDLINRPVQPNGSRYTMKTIGKAFPRGYYLVECKGHVAAMVNGSIEDWTDNRNHRVMSVSRVTVPKGSRS